MYLNSFFTGSACQLKKDNLHKCISVTDGGRDIEFSSMDSEEDREPTRLGFVEISNIVTTQDYILHIILHGVESNKYEMGALAVSMMFTAPRGGTMYDRGQVLNPP